MMQQNANQFVQTFQHICMAYGQHNKNNMRACLTNEQYRENKYRLATNEY